MSLSILKEQHPIRAEAQGAESKGKKIADHRTGDVTVDVYTHIDTERMRDAVNII